MVKIVKQKVMFIIFKFIAETFNRDILYSVMVLHFSTVYHFADFKNILLNILLRYFMYELKLW